MCAVNPYLAGDGDHSVFVSGNDDATKEQVSELLRSFGWREIIDLGDITTARGTEMMISMWLRLWATIGDPYYNFKVVR